jgi:hypothetical protein
MLGVWLGEMVHNLRACLDYVVYDLIAEQGERTGNFTKFPIYQDRKDWVLDVERRRHFWQRAKGPSPIRGITGDDLTHIEAAQPYHTRPRDRSRHPLRLLLTSSNIDKHRTLHAVVLNVRDPAMVELDPPDLLRAFSFKFPPRRTEVKQATEIVRFQYRRVVPTAMDPDVQMRLRQNIDLAFGPPGKPATGTLAELSDALQYVRVLVSALRPHAYKLMYPGRKRMFFSPGDLVRLGA